MITFLGLPDRTAGIVRGQQVSEKLPNSEFLHAQHHRRATNKICIFVRNHFPDTVAAYKNQGHVIGYDICDAPVGDVYFRNDQNPSIVKHCYEIYDFYIVNNDIAYEEIRSVTNKPVYVIPHHTVNLKNKKIAVKDEVKKVGYVGLKEQFCNAEHFQKFLNERNIEFVNIHPKTRNECDEIFQTLDIGVVFLDNSQTSQLHIDVVKKYKPNVKLSNFQSYGIPTVSIDYESYKQFGENEYLAVQTYEEFLKAVDVLISSKKLRFEMSDKSYMIGKKYHIDIVADMYKKIYERHST